MPPKFERAERPKLEKPAGRLGVGTVKPRIKKRDEPDFESIFEEDGENPLQDADLIGDLQADADTVMSTALQEIIARKKATQERFRVATDPEFFFCIAFQSRAQKDEFLRLVGWDDLGDKMINGLEVARRLEIPIEYVPIEPLKLRGKVNKFKPSDIIGGGD